MSKKQEEEAAAEMKKAVDKSIKVAEKTMYGDLLKIIVDELKALPDLWSNLTKLKQQKVLDRVMDNTDMAIRRAVEIIAGKDQPCIAAVVDQVTFKDGIKVVLTVSSLAKQRHDLADRTGQQVAVVIANPDEFMGGEEPKAEDDQKKLPIGEGDGEKMH